PGRPRQRSPTPRTREPRLPPGSLASSGPHPPQPSRPTRIAEFAAVPCTSAGLINIAPAVTAATPINLRRSILSEEFGCCSKSFDIFPPGTKYILTRVLVNFCAIYFSYPSKFYSSANPL